jgi:hypothetical protein
MPDAPPPEGGDFRVMTFATPAEVTSTPPGATVSVDGIEVGQTPWDGVIPAGRPTVTLSLEGHRTIERRPRIDTTEDETVTIDARLPAPEGFDSGLFSYQTGLQPMGLTLGNYKNLEDAGIYFLNRFMFTAARPRLGERREMLLDLGFEIGLGGFFDHVESCCFSGCDISDYDDPVEFLTYDGTRYAFREYAGLDDFHIFQLGAVLSLAFPIAVRGTRPVLAFNLSTTVGFSAFDKVAFRLNLNAGLSIFISDLVEMRLDLASFSMYTYNLELCRCLRDGGDCDWVESDQTFALVHYTPALLIGFRFR